jgi:hypothetical protein
MSIINLLNQIKNEEVVLPAIQRGFVLAAGKGAPTARFQHARLSAHTCGRGIRICLMRLRAAIQRSLNDQTELSSRRHVQLDRVVRRIDQILPRPEVTLQLSGPMRAVTIAGFVQAHRLPRGTAWRKFSAGHVGQCRGCPSLLRTPGASARRLSRQDDCWLHGRRLAPGERRGPP